MLTRDKQIRSYFRNIFGFRISNVELYKTALLHKSTNQSTTIGSRNNNERLEFLGDAVLGAIVADFLCHKYPTESEGVLTQMRSKMVNRQRLNELARKIGLPEMVSAHGLSSAQNVSGNAFEAVVGAIYMDKGYRKTARIIIKNIFNVHYDIDEIFAEDRDYKSRLIIWGQHNRKHVSFVHELFHEGRQELFRASAEVDGIVVAEGVSTSVKRAEQRAAEIALSMLDVAEF
ncbi:MAG: ribonuclease III [Bacteroidales bacterium]|nr:ribonuclease III [Bacteroidales bacterium]MDY6348103.1 ribonuclease III [Bacteroidales bacterium]